MEVVPTEVRATVAPNLLKRTRSDYHCAMDDTVVRLAGFVAWFSSQPTPIQVIVVLGVLAGLYPLLVLLRLLAAALYGAFRGLG